MMHSEHMLLQALGANPAPQNFMAGFRDDSFCK